MVKTVDLDTIKKTIKEHEVVIVYFFSNSCGPCRRFTPKFDVLAAKYDTSEFLKYDMDTHVNITAAIEFGSPGAPSILVFKKGKLANKFHYDFDEIDIMDVI